MYYTNYIKEYWRNDLIIIELIAMSNLFSKKYFSEIPDKRNEKI